MTISHLDYDNSRIQLKRPADILAIIPHLLGFHPGDSIVVMSFGPDRTGVQCLMRFDLPADSAELPQMMAHMARTLAREAAGHLVLVGYGPANYVTPALDAARTAADAEKLEVVEVLRTEDNRYWSYLCHDPECCAIDGVPFDATTNQAAVSAVMAGLVAHPDREAYTQTLAPLEGDVREEMRTATRDARDKATQLLAKAQADTHPWYEDGVERLTSAFKQAEAGEELAAHDVAWLGVILTSILVRDAAMTFIGRYPHQTHIRLWTEVTRKVEPAYAAAPASLLANSAMCIGDGPLARIALGRAFAANRGYSLAHLLETALNVGLPPTKVAEIDYAEMAPAIAAQASRSPRAARPVLPKGR